MGERHVNTNMRNHFRMMHLSEQLLADTFISTNGSDNLYTPLHGVYQEKKEINPDHPM